VKSAVILEAAYVAAPPDPDADVLVELRLALRTPPMAVPGGEVLAVEFWPRVMKASSVSPVEGALIAPTIPIMLCEKKIFEQKNNVPDWQWLLDV
jgi:hypothetical protein